MNSNYKKAIEVIKNNGIAVVPTDTIYGIVGRALDKKAVERIYKLKNRNINKPFIVLISSMKDLGLFHIKLKAIEREILKELWPGKISVILSCPVKKFIYLHRGTEALAFRLPKSKLLVDFLKQTGPLVAPSANPEGKAPAKTIKDAKNYFNEKVDFFLGQGKKISVPSTLVKLHDGKLELLRKGAYRISNKFRQDLPQIVIK